MRPSRRQASSGFSLIEVALSLAILAVGMVGVLSLLPVGLDSARQVHAETIASEVVRGAIADLATNGFQATTYGNVPSPKYYTSEGSETNQAAGYFRLVFSLNGAFNPNQPSCRYFLSLVWPSAAPTNSPIVQSRTFVTDVVRNF